MSFHQNLGLRKIFEFQNFSNFKTLSSFHQNLGKKFSNFKIFRILKFFKFQGQLTLMSFHQNLGLRKIFEFQNFSNFKIFRISRSTDTYEFSSKSGT